MKILSLNCWGGKLYDPLYSFVKKQSKDIDIFCFQEIFSAPYNEGNYGDFRIDLYEQLSKLLNKFDSYYFPTKDGRVYQELVNFPVKFGLAMFVRKGITVVGADAFRTIEKFAEESTGRVTGTGAVQHIAVTRETETYHIFNFHGLWIKGSDKLDHPLRLNQSKILEQRVSQVTDKKIVIGDFNLKPDTEAMKLLTHEMRNIVMEKGITSTRSKLYELFNSGTLYADYALVSPGVEVKNFEVLPDEVSDHLPLVLDVE